MSANLFKENFNFAIRECPEDIINRYIATILMTSLKNVPELFYAQNNLDMG